MTQTLSAAYAQLLEEAGELIVDGRLLTAPAKPAEPAKPHTKIATEKEGE